MTLARALRLVLAATLLAAWQGALVHPLEHADGHGGLVHLPGGDGDADAQCDAIAAVAACVDGRVPLAHPFPVAGDAVLSVPARAPRAVPPPAYRSQAPPQHS
jgi:hypothetical protein